MSRPQQLPALTALRQFDTCRLLPSRFADLEDSVLAPLADVAPRLVPPGWGETVETRRRSVASGEPADAVRANARWNAARGAWVREPATG